MTQNPRGSRLATRAGCCLLAVALLAARASAQTFTDPNLSVTTIVNASLAMPTAMAFIGPDDFLVLEKAGTVRRVKNGVLQAAPVLTVVANEASEHGLLGIAVNSETPRKVFLYYTQSEFPGSTPLGNRVYRYTWNATSGLLESPQLILDLPTSPGPNHNGGTLLLGPAGEAPGVGDGALLYAVIGDLNRNGQLQNNAAGATPDDSSVILRVRQDGSPAPGNPFTPYCAGSTAQTCSNDGACGGNGPCVLQVAKYYAYGVRNCFGLALDPMNGRLWDTENGPNNYDEVNLVAPGFNSGWTKLMGPDSLDPEGLADLWNMPGKGSTYSDPEFSWYLTIAPTALTLPVGSSLGGDYDGKVIVGDFNTGRLRVLRLNPARNGFDLSGFTGLTDLVADYGSEDEQLRLGSGFGAISDLKVGPDGALYVVSIGNGSIYRVTGPGPGRASSPRPPQPDARELGRRLGAAAAEALGSGAP
jgi:glucose/arabinose dehydrogenase